MNQHRTVLWHPRLSYDPLSKVVTGRAIDIDRQQLDKLRKADRRKKRGQPRSTVPPLVYSP